MKKFIVLGLIGLMVMVFSATVYAQPKLEFRASGNMQVVSAWYQNIAPGDGAIATIWAGAGVFAPSGGFRPDTPGTPLAASGAWDKTNAYMEYRGILRFDAIMGKELSGTVIFEMDSSRWGSPPGDRGNLGFWTADRAGVEVKNLYIDFALPYFGIPVPMTVRAGIQPLGHRPHMFMITDGTGVTGALKFDPVTVGLTWGKAVEGKDAAADDVDIYGAFVNAKIGTITPGIFAYNFNMNQYPLNTEPLTYGSRANYDSNMWWFGAYLDGKLGPVNLNFDFVYDYGKVETKGAVVVPPIDDEVKYRGWATQLTIDYPWQKFNFGFVGMYASGADLKKTSRTGLPGTAVADGLGFSSKVGSYVTPPGSEQWAAWGQSFILSNNYITATALPYGMWPSLTVYPASMSRGAIGGMWIAKLYAAAKLTPWYKVTLQGLYIGDTTKNGNTFGDARKYALTLRDDKTIGWEFDLFQDIQIYKNLKWSIGMGILFAGDALDQYGGGLYFSEAPKNPWNIATMLRYDF